MTPTDHANALIIRHGATHASTHAGTKVRQWATLAAFRCAGAAPLARLRYWLAVDWHIHHNASLPTV